MYRKFLNARSPLRLLEKGLHGGLGKGNLGLVLAGHGVGKTACLVGIALDVALFLAMDSNGRRQTREEFFERWGIGGKPKTHPSRRQITMVKRSPGAFGPRASARARAGFAAS